MKKSKPAGMLAPGWMPCYDPKKARRDARRWDERQRRHVSWGDGPQINVKVGDIERVVPYAPVKVKWYQRFINIIKRSMFKARRGV